MADFSHETEDNNNTYTRKTERSIHTINQIINVGVGIIEVF